MISKVSNSPDYDAYYELPEVKDENDEINADDDNQGEYVLEKPKSKPSHVIEAPEPNNRKPGHKRSEPGLYDSLDYKLSPRIETKSKDQLPINNDSGCSKKKKIFILLGIGIFLNSAIVVGVVFLLQGKNTFLSVIELIWKIKIILILHNYAYLK